MSKIILFNQTDNLYGHFRSIFSEGSDVMVVTPSPKVADATRQSLGNENIFDVITISKFLKDELLVLVGEDVGDKYKGKSELLLILSSLWKKLELEYDYDLFLRCFNLLTDFRSFSLNEDILETVLENYDESIRLGVLRMHQIMMQLDFYDEHRSYFELSERYRAGNLPIEHKTERNIIFHGFDFLSGSQVDLINTLSIRDEIYIPFRKNVYSVKTSFDWISWLENAETEVIEIQEEPLVRNINKIDYAKNYLSSTLKSIGAASSDILLGSKRISLEQILEVNIFSSEFKISTDLFEEEVAKAIFELKNNSKLNLKEKIQEKIGSKEYRYLKVLKTLKETIESWREISDVNDAISLFDIKLFQEVLALDLPRVSLINTQKEKFQNKIFSLADLESLNTNKDIVLCLASEYGAIKSSVVNYNQEVEKYLASIGPIRRSQFEYEILKEKIVNIENKNITILCEHGLLEKDYYWKDIIETLNPNVLENVHIEESRGEYLDLIPLSKEVVHYSATMLQNYYDCPRRFYYQYIEKNLPKIELGHDLTLLQKGQLEHLLIEKYVNLYDHFSLPEYQKLRTSLMLKEIGHREIEIIELTELEIELDTLTIPIIAKLLKIKSLPETTVYFETKLSDHKVKGSIDCIIERENSIFIIDFKRSGGSIPSLKEFKAFGKVQLWFYANHHQLLENIHLGYINLSENENSLVFSVNDCDADIIDILGVKSQKFKEGFESIFNDYKVFETTLIEKNKIEKEYLPRPRKKENCNYCYFLKTCSKGVISGN